MSIVECFVNKKKKNITCIAAYGKSLQNREQNLAMKPEGIIGKII
jgi:hypothetical protein